MDSLRAIVLAAALLLPAAAVAQPALEPAASGTRGDGASNLRQQSWTEFSARVRPDRTFEERISDPVIDIDDDIAMVWAPFVVRVGGKVSNCGVDHFDLVRENGTWKVMNLTFSSGTTGCPSQ